MIHQVLRSGVIDSKVGCHSAAAWNWSVQANSYMLYSYIHIIYIYMIIYMYFKSVYLFGLWSFSRLLTIRILIVRNWYLKIKSNFWLTGHLRSCLFTSTGVPHAAHAGFSLMHWGKPSACAISPPHKSCRQLVWSFAFLDLKVFTCRILNSFLSTSQNISH